MNQITLLGRLTKDPEMKYTESGTAVTRFTIAVPRDRNDKTDYINCITFGKQAESTAQYCNKGRQILVSGRLEINSRQNEQNGINEYFTTVVANRIEFLQQPKSQPEPHQQNSHQQNYHQNQQQQNQQNYQQQRFQPGPNGWQDPSDSDLPF